MIIINIMKHKNILLIIIFFINFQLFSNDISEYNKIARELTYELINREYIYSVGIMYAMSGETESRILFEIIFSAGAYEFREQFNDIIENNLFQKLKEKIPVDILGICTTYPFSIVLLNNNNYSLEEIRKIKDNLFTFGIIISHIFHNTIYGYYEDQCFGDLSERRNETIDNCFNIFLEKIIEYFGVGNIITF